MSSILVDFSSNELYLIWSYLHILAKPLQVSILTYPGSNGRKGEVEELQISPDFRPGLVFALSQVVY